jgi:serine/threonine-protein kinase
MAPTERSSAVLVPELGKYRLIAELARGGMGNVYLAIAQGPGGFHKLLAVKELKPELAEDETYVAMFLEEARLAARLIHPNIVQTNEVGSEGNRHYMIMEYLDGRSLYRVVRQCARSGGFPVGAHLRVIGEALLGLHHAHELRGFDGEPLQIVHRDVSPLNVVVAFDGQTKVLDFGIAKAADSSVETQAGVLKGRVAYMAVEQAVGEKVDRRADVYSAGVMIWEAAAGRRLWPNMTDVAILSQMLRDGPPTLRSVAPTAPAELDAICARAMARDPADRYPTALALLEDLEAHLAHRDDVLSTREIGARLSRTFAAERQTMNALVDDAMARARDPQSGTVPSFQPRVMGSVTHSLSLPVSQMRGIGEGAAGSIASLLAGSPSDAAPAERSIATVASVYAALPHPPPEVEVGRARRGASVGLLAASAFVASAFAALALLHRAPAPMSVTVPPPAAAALPVVPPAPATIDVVVRVSPATALIAIDGKPASGNPFHGRLLRDGEIHRVSASSEGYETKVEEVTFSGDLAVDVSLDRRASASRPAPAFRATASPNATASRPSKTAVVEGARPLPTPSAAEIAPPPPAPQRPDPEANAGRAPLRAIVTSNPYGAP